jgi:hypothetical protein
MVGRHRYLEILCAGHVLDDALAIVGPAVDAEGVCVVIGAPCPNPLPLRGAPPAPWILELEPIW